MVSLGNESTRSGGFFFDSDLRSDTDDLLSEPSLRQPYKRSPVRFHKLCTVYTTPVLILLMVCQIIAVFLLPHLLLHHDNIVDNKASSYSILLYSHAVLWIICLFADRFARRQHHISRQQGYLDFYRATCYLRRIPLMVVSGGNAVLLVMTTILNDYCNVLCEHKHHHNISTTTTTLTPSTTDTLTTSTTIQSTSQHSNISLVVPTPLPPVLSSMLNESQPESKCCPHLSLSHSNYLQIVLTLEALLLIPILIIYLVRTVMFNRSHPQPDVMEQDFSTTSSLQAQNSPIEIGFRDDTCVDDLMEKQAEMIRYLKEHNQDLGKRVMELTSQLNSVN